MKQLQEQFILTPITPQNFSAVYEMFEQNQRFYSFPKQSIKAAIFKDQGYRQDLAVAVFKKEDIAQADCIAAFVLVTRKGWVLGKRIYIKLCMVKKEARRKGIGEWVLNTLLTRAKEGLFRPTVHFGGSAPDYIFPGCDLRHTECLFFLKKMGFKTRRLRQNLTVELEQFTDKPLDEKDGYTFMRVEPEDFEETVKFTGKHFVGTWNEEVRLSFRNKPATTFIVKNPEGVIVGFSTHSASYPGSYGPIGILKSLRGKKLGGILLEWCMFDLKQQGHSTACINWVTGNTPKFYAKTLGAYIHPVFYPMSKRL